MGNYKRSFTSVILAFLLVITGVGVVEAESSDIQVVLVQPAVYEASSGDVLSYKLDINLPSGYVDLFSSFSVSVKFDENLSIESYNLEGAKVQKNKISLSKTKVKNNEILNFNVNDMKALGEAKSCSVKIDTKVKKTIKLKDGFNNSFVLTSIDKKGKEDSSQKDLVSNTTVTPGTLTIEPMTKSSTMVKGATEANAKISVFAEEKEIASGVADKKGNFSIVLNPQKEGTVLSVKSVFKIEGKEVEKIEKITVGSPTNEGNDNKDTENLELKLSDYLSYARKTNIMSANAEDNARLGVALANGEYIQVKSDVTSEEQKDAIEKIKEAVLKLEPSYMSGYTNGTFGPQKEISRGEVAAVFSRIVGESKEGYYSSFKDVQQEAWYADYIGQMEALGLLKGYTDGTFKPKDGMTRAEFASVIANYLQLDYFGATQSFTDVKEKHWAKDTIASVAEVGLMTGDGKGKFNPDKKITRAEVCAVVNRGLKRNVDTEFAKKYADNSFKDVEKKHWAFGDIMNATGQ